MSRVIVSTFVTLDGVMEAPGGEPGHPHTGWAGEYMGPEEVQHKADEARAAASLLVGRVTWESLAGAWPTYRGDFADRMNAMPKHVVSSTLENPGWNTATVIRGDIPSEIDRLKAADGGPMLVIGSRTLIHTLMEHDLVDEYRVMIFPVAVGSGFRMFPDTPTKTVLKLAGTRTFGSGVVEHTYRPAPA
jgi:dihydrofolate reductase